jgi:hypothetical protein
MTDNAKSIEAVAEAISATERELALFDSLTRNAVTNSRTVEILTTEILALHSNEAGLDSKARISKLTSTTSALALAQSDLKTAENAIGVVQARTIAAGRIARSACAEILSGLTNARRANAKEVIEKLLEVSQLGAFGAGLEFCARSVLELKEMEYFFNHSESDTSRQIHSLRSLPQRFDELRELCANEPGLVLRMPTIKPAPVAEMTQRQPATLNAALVAA